MKEWRRVNAELDAAKNAPPAEPAIETLPKLKRDPDSGVYRPELVLGRREAVAVGEVSFGSRRRLGAFASSGLDISAVITRTCPRMAIATNTVTRAVTIKFAHMAITPVRMSQSLSRGT